VGTLHEIYAGIRGQVSLPEDRVRRVVKRECREKREKDEERTLGIMTSRRLERGGHLKKGSVSMGCHKWLKDVSSLMTHQESRVQATAKMPVNSGEKGAFDH
jgi:hypothetical protein